MADPIQAIEEATRRRAAQQALMEAYADVFGSEPGRQVLEDIKASGCYYRTTVMAVPGGVDSAGTLVNEGARQLVLGILKNIERGRRAPVERQTEALREA